MSRDELERFLTDEGRTAIDQVLSESPDDGDSFDVAEALDRNLYSAMIRYDNQAGLSRWLSLRFTGPRTEGRIAEHAVEDVLSAFRREVVGASAANNPDVLKLDLVGFSRGSAILHLAPAATAQIASVDDSGDGQRALTPGIDQIDDALGVVNDLHTTAEDGGDVQRFYGQDGLLRGFAALSDALDRHDLDIGITWRGRTGRRRTSELTSRGREYARQYFDRSDTSDIMIVAGRVVELNISGSFDVKTGAAVNSTRYKVSTGDEESLLGLGLQLGQLIRVRVRRHVEQNRVGITFSTRYEYLGKVADSETLT